MSDLAEARSWYESRTKGLGTAFVKECDKTLKRIRQDPEWFAPDSDGIRSVRLHRFPYIVHFLVEGKYIIVIAIQFGGRDPSSWKDRR